MTGPLRDFVERNRRLFVLTGAGCSTASGIPDYRDAHGEWKRAQPVMLQDFLAVEAARQRYWARSLVGCSACTRRVPMMPIGRWRRWNATDASSSW